MDTGEANATQTAALVALLKSGRRGTAYAELVEDARSARLILEQEQGLLAAELIDAAAQEISRWELSGIRLLTVLDPEYPDNLRGVHDHPPLIFVIGGLEPRDARSAAVIGSRNASPAAIAIAEDVVACLVESGYTVVSGLARGIDTTAHSAALARRGRTLAVIGCGVERSYPPENAPLQRQIATDGAVISQFWPDTPPAAANFPMRNAVMSGMALATVIVEAGPTSGARIQARLALAHGRPVLLMDGVLTQDWATELARRPGVHVVNAADSVPALIDHLSSAEIAAT